MDENIAVRIVLKAGVSEHFKRLDDKFVVGNTDYLLLLKEGKTRPLLESYSVDRIGTTNLQLITRGQAPGPTLILPKSIFTLCG